MGRFLRAIGFAFIVAIMVTGCAINRQAVRDRIIDRTDPISITDQLGFQNAVNECTEYATRELQRVQNEQIGRAFMGALLGAGVGYGASKLYGLDSRYVSATTALTAAGGASAGAASVMNPVDVLIYNCMTNRGFKMLY